MPKRDLKPRTMFDAKGRVVIPQWIREKLSIKKGAFAEIEVYGEDKILLTVLRK